MGVIGYQVFIALSLVLVRFFAPQHLLLACYIWSGFTVFNLFYWPLIFLQLFVIWGVYGVISSSEDGGVSSESKKQKTLKKVDDNSASEVKITGGFVRALEHMNDFVLVASIVQKFTLNVRSQVATEKCLIEAALREWDRKVEIDDLKMTPEERVLYDATILNVRNILRATDAVDDLKNRLPFEYRTPDFSVNLEGLRLDIANAVRRELKSISDSRDEYIDGVLARLKDDLEFRTIFLFELNALSGSVLRDFFLNKIADDVPTPQILNEIDAPIKSSAIVNSTADVASLLKEVDNKIHKEIGGSSSNLLPAPVNFIVENPFLVSDEIKIKKVSDKTVDETPLSYLSILSFPTPKNEERLKIKSIAWSRRIPFLVHFTRAVNLPTIMTHGICSIERSKEIGLSPSVNDEFRMDGYLNAASFSISFPNSRMFYKYRMLNPSEEWVVLIIRPQVLWDKKNAFCSFNAADTRVKKRVLSELSLPSAFEQMFEERDEGDSRVSQGLMAFEPTDVQAEVLVFECVEPHLITEIIFDNKKILSKYRGCIGNKISRIHRKNRGMFSSRGYYINSRKNV